MASRTRTRARVVAVVLAGAVFTGAPALAPAGAPALAPVAPAPACSGRLAPLLRYAGTYRGERLLAEQAVAEGLRRLPHAAAAHLRRNVEVAGPVALIGCHLVVSGNAPHRGGVEEAIVDVDVASGRVSAALLSAGGIAIFVHGHRYAAAVPLAIKDWIAVVYTRGYFRSHPPANARLIPLPP